MNVIQKGCLLFKKNSEYVGKWAESVYVCKMMVVVGEGLISRQEMPVQMEE